MGVIIHKIREVKDNLHITVSLEKKGDFKLMQALFRDCISSRLCIESRFGLNKSHKEISVFNYPINIPFELIYQSNSGRVGLTYIPVKMQ